MELLAYMKTRDVKYTNRIVSLMLLSIFLSFMLFSCGSVVDNTASGNNTQGNDDQSGNTDQLADADCVALDKASLFVASPRKTNITLPTSGNNGSVITWESSNISVITNDGVVTSQNEHVCVNLKASLKKGSVTDSAEFAVFVVGTGTACISVDLSYLSILPSAYGTWCLNDFELFTVSDRTITFKGDENSPVGLFFDNKGKLYFSTPSGSYVLLDNLVWTGSGFKSYGYSLSKKS